MRMRGTMLWFNSDKDVGALETIEGVRLHVPGEAFEAGERPVGRCAGMPIEFDSRGSDVSEIAFVHDVSPRRARIRHYR
jgi:hypothetical protein